MIQPFATMMPRGISWLWLAIVAVALTPVTVQGQGVKPPVSEKKSAEAETKPVSKDDTSDDAPAAEVFIDPGAKKAITIFNPLNFSGPALNIKIGSGTDDRAKVQGMASRASNTDPDFLKRYVEFFTVELTKRDNLNALLNPPANAKATDIQARALERAVDALNKPIIDAKANENREFLNTYTRILFESTLPKLLESNHNYLSRIDAMIVLGMAGSTTPSALDLYIAQIKKPDQLIWVKLWAARGLTNAARGGAVDLDAAKANLAAEALVGFLESDSKLPWPAQLRALEAIGSIRVASVSTPRGKVDVASVVMKYLIDPTANSEVRSWAAWALGFLKVPSSISPYNFTLVGQEIGELVVDLGTRIVQDYDDDPMNFDKEKDMASHLTSLLLFQVYPSLIGQEGVRDSGLVQSTHKNAVEVRPFLTKLDDKIKATIREAYELLKSAGASNETNRNDLHNKLVDLKSYLGSTVLKDRHLVPGGPDFPPTPNPQVAGAAGP